MDLVTELKQKKAEVRTQKVRDVVEVEKYLIEEEYNDLLQLLQDDPARKYKIFWEENAKAFKFLGFKVERASLFRRLFIDSLNHWLVSVPD